jgi:SAM-dependent methyltransferase
MPFVCPSWLAFILYNPVRKAFTDRDRVMDESLIAQDSVVLEIGAGNGFFTEAVATRASHVIAVELQEGMVRKLRNRVQRFGDRVEIIAQDIASADLGEGIADVCLLYYSFHEVRRRNESGRNISRAVKSGGVLAIYEPTLEVPVRLMRDTIDIFEENGFSLELERSTLVTRFARLRKR